MSSTPTIPRNRKPTSVGEMLLEEYLKPLGLTQQQFADALKVDRPAVNAILNGRRALSVEMALRLARVLGTTPQFWLNLQMMGDLYEAQRSPESRKIARLRQLASG
jgi:addiction module HigA family antidote